MQGFTHIPTTVRRPRLARPCQPLGRLLGGALALVTVLSAPTAAQNTAAQNTAPNASTTHAGPQEGNEHRYLTQRSLADVQNQLADLERFPLFFSSDPSILVAASSQLSASAQSQPSLSWMEEQIGMRYGSDRLIEQWQAYRLSSSLSYVDVIVNESIWSLLNYFERYAFITQFATAAKSYGYNLRVFHTGDVANQRDVSSSGRRFRNNTRFQPAVLRGANFCNFPETISLSRSTPSATDVAGVQAPTDLPARPEPSGLPAPPLAPPLAPPSALEAASTELRCNIVLEVLSNRPVRQQPFDNDGGLILP